MNALKDYLKDRQVQPLDRPNLASLIGNRFLSLSAFEHGVIKPATNSCYEFLALHEIMFEWLLCDKDIQQKLGIDKSVPDIRMQTNKMLSRICAMAKRVSIEDVDYERHVKPMKVSNFL
jgi:hypothetical protein